MPTKVSLDGLNSRKSDCPAGTSTDTDGTVIRRFTPVTGVASRSGSTLFCTSAHQRVRADGEPEERAVVEPERGDVRGEVRRPGDGDGAVGDLGGERPPGGPGLRDDGAEREGLVRLGVVHGTQPLPRVAKCRWS